MATTPSSSVQIRKAKTTDLKAIFQLVKELAAYEKASSEVTATLQDYQNAFDECIFDAIVAIDQGQIVGTAVYYVNWSTWKGRMLYLEDLVVNSDFRKKGIGQKLFDAFIDEARSLGCQLVKWQVLDWNEPAISFYKKNNATIEKEWLNGKIVFSDLS